MYADWEQKWKNLFIAGMVVLSAIIITLIVLASIGTFSSGDGASGQVTNVYSCSAYDSAKLKRENNLVTGNIAFGASSAATPDGLIQLSSGLADIFELRSRISEFDADMVKKGDDTAVFTGDIVPYLANIIANDEYMYCLGVDPADSELIYLCRVQRTSAGYFFKGNSVDRLTTWPISDVFPGVGSLNVTGIALDPTHNLNVILVGLGDLAESGYIISASLPSPSSSSPIVTIVVGSGTLVDAAAPVGIVVLSDNRIATIVAGKYAPLLGATDVSVVIYERTNMNALWTQTQTLFGDSESIANVNNFDGSINSICLYDNVAGIVHIASLDSPQQLFVVSEITITNTEQSPQFCAAMFVTADNCIVILDTNDAYVYSLFTGERISTIPLGISLSNAIVGTNTSSLFVGHQNLCVRNDVPEPFIQFLLNVFYINTPIDNGSYTAQFRIDLDKITVE
jgi:hypothetical protein